MDTKVDKSMFHTGGGDAFSNNIGIVHGDVNYYGCKPGKRPAKEEIEIWLKPITADYTYSHKKAWNVRADDTGQWLLNCPQFKQWRDGIVRYLACKGKPGAGKTVMSSVVIEFLLAHFQPNSDTAIFYVYIRNDERSTHSIACVLSTLLLRIIKEGSDISNDVVKLYEECNHDERQDKIPDLKSVKAILEAELSRLKHLFIVVDALDEWDPTHVSSNTPEELIHVLESLAANVKMMVTSRNHIPFSQDGSKYCGNIVIGAQSQDIQAYLSLRRRQGLFKRVDCSEEDMDKICRMIEDKAEGMFIVVQVVADSISVLPTMAEILDLLKHIDVANGLDGMWDLTLKRIEKSPDRDLTFAFLAWLLYTEDISVVAVQHGLAEQFQQRRNDDIDLDRCLVAVKHLLSISCGLVTVGRKMINRGLWYGRHEDACFQFVHFTTKESLSKIIPNYIPRAHSAIGLACLRYLSRRHLDAITEHTFKCYPLLECALLNWHRLACKESCDHLAHELAYKVYQNPFHLASLLRFTAIPRPKPNTAPEAYFSMLLALHGPTCMLKERWNDKFKSTRDENHRTLLTFAAIGGNAETVHFLLSRGCNTSKLDAGRRSSLSYAAEYGHIELVKLLVRPGATLKAWGLPASSYGLLSKARDLVFDRRGTTLNTPDNDSYVPLMYAARYGHEEVVKLLLEEGADLNRLGDYGRTSISYAAEMGHREVVKLLLERGASPDQVDQYQRDSISYMAENGHEEVVKLLLERGADPNRLGDHGRTPASYAAEKGHEAVVKLLLERGADPHRRDFFGRTPISYAEKWGREEVDTLLQSYAQRRCATQGPGS